MRAGGSPRRASGSSSTVPDGAEGSGTSRVVIDDPAGAVGVDGGVDGGGVAGDGVVHVDGDMAARKRRRLRRACADDPTRDDGADRDTAGWGSDLSGGDTDGDFESRNSSEEEEEEEGSGDESWEASEEDG